jgi:hypothetical protein
MTEKTIESVVLDGFDRIKQFIDKKVGELDAKIKDASAAAEIAQLKARVEKLEEHVIGGDVTSLAARRMIKKKPWADAS